MIKKFYDFLPLVNQLASGFSKKYHLEFDDIQAQGFLIFVECQKTYDENRSQFSTWLSCNLKQKLNDYCKKEKLIENRTENISENISMQSTIEKKIEFWDSINELTDESKKIIQYILQPKKDYVSRRVTKNSLKKELRRGEKWSFKFINDKFNEISIFLEKNYSAF